MRRRAGAAAALSAGLMLAVPLVWAQETGIPVLDAFTWRYNGQAFLYALGLARTPDSVLNPGNRFAQLPNLTQTTELRPNLSGSSAYLDVVVHPRVSSIFLSGGVSQQETVRGYLQEGYIRAKPTDQLSITAGRQLLTWGPAYFRSPSNPYYFNNARLNPILELSGIDLAMASYSVTPQFTLTGGVVFQSGHNLVANDRYRNSALLKADYRGTDSFGSLVLSSIRGRSLFVGGYGQITASDSTLIYGEFGASSGTKSPDLIETGNGTLFTPSTTSQRSATALIGASYTFENGHSINAEYLFNGYGYGTDGARRYFAQAQRAGGLAALGNRQSGLETLSLGTASGRAQDLLGRHYAYVQYQNNPSQGTTVWRVMAAQNLVDHSTQPSFYIEHSITPRVSLFSLGTAGIGPRKSEFGAFYRYSLMAGAKVFLF